MWCHVCLPVWLEEVDSFSWLESLQKLVARLYEEVITACSLVQTLSLTLICKMTLSESVRVKPCSVHTQQSCFWWLQVDRCCRRTCRERPSAPTHYTSVPAVCKTSLQRDWARHSAAGTHTQTHTHTACYFSNRLRLPPALSGFEKSLCVWSAGG